MEAFQRRLEEDRALVEANLRDCFKQRESMANLYDAMEYSLLAGGKRLRPILTLEVCRMCGGDPKPALPFACAVEMVHTYSLIHDDLPCMDDDDLRRGRPTNHKVYGEATAVLAGDGLLTAAFETALEAGTGNGLPPDRVLEAAACLARSAGARGMVGGQSMDIAAEGHALTQPELEHLQALKTGALISAAAEMGCIVAGGGREDREAVRKYAAHLGLAFQIRDDMLDVEGNEQTLGKPVGSDRANGKTTFVTLKGLDHCRCVLETLTQKAVLALDRFSQADFLTWLAESLIRRES